MTSASTDTVVVSAEWPGTVAELHVGVGDTVEAEQEVITLESMKMLTPVLSPVAGTVAEILVEEGQFVDEGQAMLNITTS